MEGHRATRAVVALGLAGWLAVAAPQAGAEGRDDDLSAYAETVGQGVDYGAEARAEATGTTSRRRSGCRYRVETYPNAAPQMNYEAYRIYCDDRIIRSGFRYPNQPDPAAVSATLERLLDRLDIQDGTIDIRPNNKGVVAIPAYFWITGYDGTTITQTDTIAGTTLTVTATLTTTEWDFGDNTTPVEGSLGQPWPQRSDVHHSYRDASYTDRPHQVTATLWFQPTFTVGTNDAGTLDPFPIELTTPYIVRDIQAVRHS